MTAPAEGEVKAPLLSFFRFVFFVRRRNNDLDVSFVSEGVLLGCFIPSMYVALDIFRALAVVTERNARCKRRGAKKVEKKTTRHQTSMATPFSPKLVFAVLSA